MRLMPVCVALIDSPEVRAVAAACPNIVLAMCSENSLEKQLRSWSTGQPSVPVLL